MDGSPPPPGRTTPPRAEQPGTESSEEPGDDETVEPDAALVAAADFLARELRAQDHLIVNWSFNDYGLTTDFALALAATGLHSADAEAAAAKIAETIEG
ncbi:MAG: hypothetical protein Q4G67_15810, partial [Actinomycetia bacterium]|nr:hypothetical protein [Actinomycetes bacterium]